MLEFKNLGKAFDGDRLFTGLDYRGDAGCVALTNESDRGKSVLLAILAGKMTADQGEIRVTDLPGQAGVAYIPDDCLDRMVPSGRAFLEQVAASRKAVLDSKALALLEAFDLLTHLDKPFEQMSVGTRKKFFVVASTLGAVRTIIADGPSDGLDLASRRILAQLFKTLGQDRLVFFASYDSDLVEACGAREMSFADFTDACGCGCGCGCGCRCG